MLFPVRNSKENLFVLASEPDGDLECTHLPILSKLQFNKNRKQLELRESGRFASSIDLNSNLLRLGFYKMEFLYLYEVTNYVFVLKREKESWQPTKTRLGKLVIDPDEEEYSHGYVELPLSCTNPNTGETLTYAESAHFGFGDSWLSNRSDNSPWSDRNDGILDLGDTLFVTFNSFNDALSKVDASKGSILCAFPQEQLKNEFGKTMESCRQGDWRARLMTRYSAINGSTRCSRRRSRTSSHSSSREQDEYVESLETVQGHYLNKLKNEVITSLASTVHRKSPNETNNLFALGTAEGKLYQLIRENDTLKSEVKFNLEATSNKITNLAINANPLVDESDHAYFAASQHLIKVSLSERECKGPKLNGTQIYAIGDAMGKE